MTVIQYKNYSYLKGPKGDKGDKGDIGPRGPRGDKGDPGPRGPAGSGASTGIIRTAISATLPVTYNAITGVIGFDDTGFATETYVNTAIANLVDSAPELLNTLNEIAAALGDNPDFINAVVLKTGSTMTGLLTLSGTPTQPLHAATKQYVDDSVSSTAGALTTDDITEAANLYFTDARARAAIGVTGAATYDNTTGIINVTGGVTSVNTQVGDVVLDTTDIAEGTNLYYTTARANTDFDTRLAEKTTTNLTEGLNLYYTTARANTDFDTRLAEKTTTNLTEGTNLYYTDSRARTAISVAGAGSYDNTTGVITITGGVTSVNSQTGAVVLDTDNISEAANLYFTDTRARAAISVTGSLTYDSSTGVIGYTAPVAEWDGVTFDGGDFDGGIIVSGELAIDGGFLESYYNPANASDWAAPAPSTVAEALDRLAAVVKTLNGGTGA